MSAPITPVSKSSGLSDRQDGKVPSVLKESKCPTWFWDAVGWVLEFGIPPKKARPITILGQGADHIQMLLLVVLRFQGPCSVFDSRLPLLLDST